MRWNNETPLPRPPVLDHGVNEEVPSRESGRSIPIRVFKPRRNTSPSVKGVFLHIHGGGWVLQSHEYQDTYLDYISEQTGLVTVSVGYRLAPEHPYPTGPEDCYDAIDYLTSDAGLERFGGPVRFICGESAGGHLTMTTFLHLATQATNSDATTNKSAITAIKELKSLICHYGAFNLAEWFPSTILFKPRPDESSDPTATLVMDGDIMNEFRKAFLPNSTSIQRLDPFISPFYANWSSINSSLLDIRGGLPPVLFTCGTHDPLLDDSVMMCAKWQMSSGDASKGVLKIYPGAPHGFTGLAAMGLESAKECMGDFSKFMQDLLGP